VSFNPQAVGLGHMNQPSARRPRVEPGILRHCRSRGEADPAADV